MASEKGALVSIITVNYNQAGITFDLLKSLRGLTYKNIEIIVVDNNSEENPKPLLNKAFPEAKVIVSNKNLGFAGGNNLGCKEANGDYIYFVNNDTELPKGSLEPLVARFEADASIGMISPKILYFEPKNLIQYAGYTAINRFTARNKNIGGLEVDKGQYDKPRDTHYAHGAAMMISRKVMQKVGLMSEIFFLYYEEMDWCERIKRAGFKIFYEPSSFIYHKESVSVGKLSTLKTYYMTRNRILFMRRNFTKANVYIFYLFLIVFTIPKNTLLYVLKRQFDHVKAFYKGVAWNLRHKNIA